MGQAQVRDVAINTREELIAYWGGEDEKTARARFSEGTDSGAELTFIENGVAIWLPVGDRDGDEYLLRSLGRAEMHYPIEVKGMLDVLDAMYGLFISHCSLVGMYPLDVHELTQVAMGLQSAADEEDNDDDRYTVALEQLASRVICAGCGRHAPVLYQETTVKDVWRLEVHEFVRDEIEDLRQVQDRGDQVALSAHCPNCNNEWPVRVDLGELL